MFKKLTACLLVLALTMPNLLAFAQEPAARNLSVFRVDGEEAFLARSLGGRGMVPQEGNRLNLGNVMTTGIETQVYMQLDAASIVKMDEESEVAVAAAGNLLSLSVFRGSALVEVEQLAPEHTLETRIGSTVMSVRGTLFIAGIREGGTAVITMLSGKGAVYVADETGAIVEMPLTAGNVFWAHEADVDEAFNIRPLDLQTMSLFELQETWNYREYLLEIGTITPAMDAQLQQLIGVRQNERQIRRGVQDAAITAQDAQVPSVQAALPEPVVQVQASEAAPTPATAPTNAMVGQIIQFGGFDWLVLDVRGNRALVISEYVLFYRRYHHTLESFTWETSDIRRYLNNDFFNRFSSQDQARIALMTVINNNNQWYGTPGGSNTTDRIFLMSIDEVLRYFGDSDLTAQGAAMAGRERWDNQPRWPEWGIYLVGIHDQYSEARIARSLRGPAAGWWLRSPGESPNSAAVVGDSGLLYVIGAYAVMTQGVRPALWLYLD